MGNYQSVLPSRLRKFRIGSGINTSGSYSSLDRLNHHEGSMTSLPDHAMAAARNGGGQGVPAGGTEVEPDTYVTESRKYWALATFCIMIYNTTIPIFRVCFLAPASMAFLVFDWILDVLVWCDIVYQFTVPYLAGGDVVNDPKMIKKHYLKTWFVLDVLSVLPLDIAMIAVGNEPLLRLNRLLRGARLYDYFNFWQSNTSIKPSIITILKFPALVAVFSHYMACLYFVIYRNSAPEASVVWSNDLDLFQSELSTQYFFSLWWSVATMTGYGNTDSVTDLQAGFSFLTVFLGVAAYVAIIGYVGNVVAELDAVAAAFRQKVDSINNYMKYRDISVHLQEKIHRYYRYLWQSRMGIDESEILNSLPNYLRLEVAKFLYKKFITKVKIFEDADPEFVRAIIGRIEPEVYLPDTWVIRKGEIGREMFFCGKGIVEVVGDPDPITGERPMFARLETGAVFGEQALLTNQVRNASIRTVTFCDLYRLDKVDFDEVMEDFPALRRRFQELAEKREQSTAVVNSRSRSGSTRAPSLPSSGQFTTTPESSNPDAVSASGRGSSSAPAHPFPQLRSNSQDSGTTENLSSLKEGGGGEGEGSSRGGVAPLLGPSASLGSSNVDSTGSPGVDQQLIVKRPRSEVYKLHREGSSTSVEGSQAGSRSNLPTLPRQPSAGSTASIRNTPTPQSAAGDFGLSSGIHPSHQPSAMAEFRERSVDQVQRGEEEEEEDEEETTAAPPSRDPQGTRDA